MGYRTIVVVNNDDWDAIQRDAQKTLAGIVRIASGDRSARLSVDGHPDAISLTRVVQSKEEVLFLFRDGQLIELTRDNLLDRFIRDAVQRLIKDRLESLGAIEIGQTRRAP